MRNSWKLAYVAVIGLLAMTLGGCSSDDPVGPNQNTKPEPTPVYKTVTIQPEEIRDLHPILVKGDNDFDGHGPDMNISASLTISSDLKSISLSVEMNAVETAADWSTAQIRQTKTVYTAPAGWVIEIPKVVASSSKYVDRDIFLDTPPVTGTLVKSLTVAGNTLGGDIGPGIDHCRIASMKFNKIDYTLRQL